MEPQAFEVLIEKGRFDRAVKRLPPELRQQLGTVIQQLTEPIPPRHLRYENLEGSSQWRSVRLDNRSGYRVIFYEEANRRVLTWVDAHDDAYRWARENKPRYNDYGEFEIVSETLPPPPCDGDHEEATLNIEEFPFAAYEAKDLVRLGVPNIEWAEYLRSVRGEILHTELVRLRDETILTEPTYERLYWLAEGEPLFELLPPAQLNLLVEEFFNNSLQRGALWKPEDWRELQSYLERPWERWLVFLNPSQREMTRKRFAGPARVTGGPGTGKTIVALHRARELARRYAPERVLLTSFNKSLANELRRRMSLLAGNLPNLVIQHLDEFIREQVRSFYPQVKIIYDGNKLRELTRFDSLVTQLQTRLTPKFIWEEWLQVIDAWGIRTEQKYLDTERTGRGRALQPDERRALWQVFERMLVYLRNAGVMTPNQACYELERRFRSKPPFRCVIVDETQDFGPAQMRLIRALAPADAPDNLFFCADVAQRIYARSVPWKRYEINVQGRSRRLRINYRNTLEIQQASERVLPPETQMAQAKSLDDPEAVEEAIRTGWRPIPVLRNPDAPPRLQPCKSRVDEAEKLKEWIQQCKAEGIDYSQMAVIARTKEVVNEIVSVVLRDLGLTACEFEQRVSEYQIYADTAHAIKGLEFRAVAIVAADLFPLTSVLDPADSEDALQRERNLLYTAMTRPRERLYISWIGNGTPFLPAV